MSSEGASLKTHHQRSQGLDDPSGKELPMVIKILYTAVLPRAQRAGTNYSQASSDPWYPIEKV
jgi:hypothetical protein